MNRGRKSQAELAVAPVAELSQIPRPPKHLTTAQADVWRMVMASRSAEMVEPEAYPVLVEYCRLVVTSNQIAEQLARFDPDWIADEDGLKRYGFLVDKQDKIAGRVSSLAVKLRLTPSTRFDSGTAARVGKKSTRKPWQLESDD
jgi:phage terminase small subunit